MITRFRPYSCYTGKKNYLNTIIISILQCSNFYFYREKGLNIYINVDYFSLNVQMTELRVIQRDAHV